MRASASLAAGSVLLALLSGCGLGLMQTARTTPPGELDANVAAGYVYNQMIEERGHALTNFQLQLGLRYGVCEQLDLGASLFMGVGALLDAKYNFLPADLPLAAALQAGFGAARDIGSGATVLHLPLRAVVSYDFLSGWLIPYAGLGLGLFWILGYGGEAHADGELVGRTGSGDGLIMLSAGLALFGGTACALYVEYSWWRPVLDDPGDRFAFADNHIFMAGVRF
ncbi:MAG: hypothetical protein JXR96_27615 [Deltaproteobacteria bacterium]|nr:hypothetical protein [Deltaproteobacteria bacterium]